MGAGDPERAARLTVLPLNARDAGATHRLHEPRMAPCVKKRRFSNRKKTLEFVGRTRVPSRIHSISEASVCCTCSLMGLRTSDNRCKRELLSLQKHMNCKDAVTSVNCFRLLFEAPECRCPPKPLSNRLAVPAANAQHTPQPKCRCKIAKFMPTQTVPPRTRTAQRALVPHYGASHSRQIWHLLNEFGRQKIIWIVVESRSVSKSL